MKFYKCDVCGEVFDPEDGMIKGWYEGGRKIRWSNPGGSVEELKVRKTLKIYREVPAGDGKAAHETEVPMDACRSCVVKFERP